MSRPNHNVPAASERRRARRRRGSGTDARGAPGAGAAPPPQTCETRVNNTYSRLLACVTLEGVREHQAAFQAIADANGGNRAAGDAGVRRERRLRDREARSGRLDVSRPTSSTTRSRSRSCSSRRPPPRTSPATSPAAPSGTVTAAVTPIDINLTPPRANTSGCDGAYTEAAVGAPLTADPGGVNDFAGFVPGRIALIQRGGCSFALKVVERPGRRRCRGHPLQPGQHARAQRRAHEHHGRRRRPARPSPRSPCRWSARASTPVPHSPRPARLQPSRCSTSRRPTCSPSSTGATTTTSSWPEPISTPSKRAPGSTTTGAARQR